MEITDINIISDFEAGIKYLENPSLISRFFSISAIQNIAPAYSFWKWSALILAIFATFSRLINRIVFFLVLRIRTVKSINCSLKPLLNDDDDYFDFSEDDLSSSVAESDDDELESTSLFEDLEPVNEYSRVPGSSYYSDDEHGNMKLRRRCFSWSDFAVGKSVVQLWDRLGLGLDFDEKFGSEISVWDLDKSEKISSFYEAGCHAAAVEVWSPFVVLSGRMNHSESIALDAYDTRVAREMPVINADWRPSLENVVGISSGGVEKVYIRDDVVGGITVCDLRNVKTPLGELTESGCGELVRW